jgi:two-component system, LytTR family, sensor kinase
MVISKSGKLKNSPILLVVLFLLFLFIINIFLGLAINFINGKFSYKFFEITSVNSIFLSIGIILNILITVNLFNKIKRFLLFSLAILIIFGVNLTGFIYIFIYETFFFIYETNLVNSYLLLNFIFSIALSFITTGFIYYQRTTLENEKILNEEKALMNKMEENLYRSKVNPHFLFNTLNMIISLLKEPLKAEKAMVALSELLRFNLSVTEKDLIPVKDEIESIEKYLYIQKLRFEERLEFKINCSENFSLPPLILQPLVENSIKHNIGEKARLKIEINIYKKDKKNIIEIYDSFRKLDDKMVDTGTGLSITKQRVELTGGEFIIKDGGVTIIL